METNSHTLGLIQETVVAFEIVTSHGELLRVTKENNPELFYALPWSHGTLGFLVAVELKILPIKPFMHVKYIPCHTKEDLCKQMKELSEADDAPQFLEATVYSKETSVIMVCEFADADTPDKRKKINGVNYFWCVVPAETSTHTRSSAAGSAHTRPSPSSCRCIALTHLVLVVMLPPASAFVTPTGSRGTICTSRRP